MAERGDYYIIAAVRDTDKMKREAARMVSGLLLCHTERRRVKEGKGRRGMRTGSFLLTHWTTVIREPLDPNLMLHSPRAPPPLPLPLPTTLTATTTRVHIFS